MCYWLHHIPNIQKSIHEHRYEAKECYLYCLFKTKSWLIFRYVTIMYVNEIMNKYIYSDIRPSFLYSRNVYQCFIVIYKENENNKWEKNRFYIVWLQYFSSIMTLNLPLIFLYTYGMSIINIDLHQHNLIALLRIPNFEGYKYQINIFNCNWSDLETKFIMIFMFKHFQYIVIVVVIL